MTETTPRAGERKRALLPTDDHRPIASRAGTSPTSIELPFWLDAVLTLDPPRKPNGTVRTTRHAVYPAARALMADRINARGDEAVQLDRAALARWCGYSRADNCRWITAYLEHIGFLEVHRHSGRDGQEPDTFDVFPEPPANYIGPRSYAELDMALRDDAPMILFVPHQRNPWSEPNPATEGMGANPNPATEGMGLQNPWSEPNPATEGFSRARRFDSSLPPVERTTGGRESEVEPGTGGAAEPPAPGEQEDAVRALTTRLPWQQWANRSGSEFAPSTRDLDQLDAAIVRAIDTGGITLGQAQDIALAALGKATGTRDGSPVPYLVSAFGKQLGTWLRSVCPAELSNSPLPLPEPADDTEDVTAANSAATTVTPATTDTAQDLPACSRCRAATGESKGMRMVLIDASDATSGEVPCPECHPSNNAA